jgi:hypothetical protein
MARAKPSKPRDIGFNHDAMNMAQNSNVKLVIDRWQGSKVARRMFSVFDQLATNGKTVGNVTYPPTLTKNEAVAGNNMFALYATWKGLAGAPDNEDVGFVQCSRPDKELLTDRMKVAGNEWRKITGRMQPGNAALIAAISHDMLTSDGAMIDTKADRPVVRWRKVVASVCGINDRDCQRDAVKRMCVDLAKVMGC